MESKRVHRYAVITLFPEMFTALTEYGVSGRAVKNGLVEVAFFNPRKHTTDKHQTVDDRPYGGGPGMVMRIEPLKGALEEALSWVGAAGDEVKVIYLSPQGRPLSNSGVEYLSEYSNLVFIAGRYEGIDERFIESFVDEEWSVGDYVLSGGELPAMVVMDAVIRMLPGVLGHEKSAVEDSFYNGLLDCPHYTRPESFNGMKVPDVLLSGDHQRIADWRKEQSVKRTTERRPDLLSASDSSEGVKSKD